MRRLIVLATCMLMGLAAGPSSQPAQSPAHDRSGASAAFTTHDPLVLRARQLADEGKFFEARAILTQKDASGDGREPATRDRAPRSGHDLAAKDRAANDPRDPRAREEMLDILDRTRAQYALDGPALLARLRESIPDASAADLERWRASGEAQYRMIDGQVRFFSREPANIFRFCDEAIRQRKPPAPPAAGWTLVDHLARVVSEAKRTGQTQVVPIRHRVRYSLTVPADAPGLKPGALVRIWLPFPQEYSRQRDVKLISSNPHPALIAPPARGEPLTVAPQRTAYFERRVGAKQEPMVFEEAFEFTTWAFYPDLDDARAKPLPPIWGDRELAERLPHIVFSPEMKATAAKIVGDETNPLRKARKIFNFVATNISYWAEEEYGTIPSLSAKALRTGRGDCGVQTMLFITLCRCAGIPARWQTGWETKRVGFDMHDWCEFYVEPWGWLPADPSYGLQKSGDPAIRDFYFGHQDSYRMIVNVDYGRQLHPPKGSLRSEPLDFQRGEVEIDGKNLYFGNWDYDMNLEWLDPGP